MPDIGFIGAGTVGTALAVRLKEKGYAVTCVASRTLASAERLAGMVEGCHVHDNNQAVAEAVEMIFITTSDDAIASVAAQVKWRHGQSVAHCSGADSLDILNPAAEAGARTGAFHPLQTFASITHAIENIPGSTFALEAEEPLMSTLKEIALALDGNPIELKPGDKVIYHTAAVLACNYLVTLVKMATDLWQTFDVPPAEATRALLPLLRGTINNLDNVGLPDCLTGPIARGDLGTVKKHLTALEATAPELLSAYRELGRQTVPIARAKGKIDDQVAKELREVLGEPIFKNK
ncbi:Rossmann-like and DUF2520 domain-containing protein [Chloroflexota bacterium]